MKGERLFEVVLFPFWFHEKEKKLLIFERESFNLLIQQRGLVYIYSLRVSGIFKGENAINVA